MSDTQPSKRFRRTKYILDKEWQLAVFRNMAVVALIAGVLQMVTTHLLSRQGPLERWSGQQIGMLSFASNALFLVIVFVALAIVSVRVTHSVVGPAMVIQRAVDGLLVGKFDSRLTLRKNDYLTELASSVKRLSDHIQEQTESNEKLARDLEEALTRGDVTQALELARSLGSSSEPLQEERARCAA